ncbi:MAG: hypothetical protein H6842_04565 [Rhodospirillaceae bacterium]|nr:hypothetical protein [Rhodospirillaceae bacterium]
MAAAPATQATPPAAPVPRQRVADTRPAAPAQVAQSPPAVASWPRQAAHLASYRQAGDAETGWQVLSARHTALRDMTPVLVSVDIPGRGRFLRLFAVPGSDAALRPLCAEMQGVGNYCQPMTITAADGAVALFGGTVPQATASAPEAPVEPAPPAVAEAPPPAPEPAEPAVAQDDAQPAEPAAEPPTAAEAPTAEEPQVAAMVDTGPLPGGSHGAATTAVGAIPGDWRGGLEGTPDAEAAPAQEPHPDHAAEEPVAVEPAAEESAAEEPAAEQHAAAPPAPEPAPQADVPANPETASAATMLTPDFLYGRWGFSDPETGCNSADFIAFYPEGSANLYDELEGTWEIDGELVHLHLTALDEVRSSGRRDIFLDMRVENITDDRFQATFVSAGESAAMAAFRCR